MERKEILAPLNISVYQDDEFYCFTSDAILLSEFTRVKKGDIVADFCSGCGIVGLNLLGLNKDKIKTLNLFEMQTPLYNLAVKSIEENNLSNIVSANNCRLQDITSEFNGKFSLITCNPPYMAVGKGFIDEKDAIAMCRTEVTLSLEELVKAFSKCLKYGGRVNLVHRADRLCEVICELQKNNIEPKRIQFVSGSNKQPYLFLMEAVKGGKTGVKIEKNITN